MASLALAARAAHDLRDYPARDMYLKRMDELGQEDAYLREVTRADLLLQERRYLDALQALDRLPSRHTGALKLELKAHQLARNWDQVLALLPQLERRKVMEPSVLTQTRRLAVSENLERKALDARSFREYWDKLPAGDQRDPMVAGAASRCFIELADTERAHAVIEDSLAEEWNPSLLPLYLQGLPRDARRYLERAEQWLEKHPDDPALLLALGELCIHQGLWGKARSYLEASIALEPNHMAYVKLGELLERTGEREEAGRVYRRGLELMLERPESLKAHGQRPTL
jgi:HemY protein